ncbi:MAG: EamA family transporter [Holophaga sp.]|jgi:drug/metabolite transporter (DMT)-like permease
MNKRLITLTALLIVYFLWGGTYLGIRLAVATIPPYLMAGTRFLLAGSLVYLYARLTGAEPPLRAHWIDGGIAGGLLLLGGNGLICWSEQLVPSGIAALLVATVPLWMILLGLLGKDRRWPGIVVLVGILLGFSGIGLLVLPAGGASGRVNPAGIAALVVASFLWSLGSLSSRRARVPASPLLAVSLQMIVGGALMLLASGLLGEWPRLVLARVTLKSVLGMGYLVLFGSIIAYSAYIWLLKNADPTWVSTYAFVNPIVAVFVGWLIAGERLTTHSLWATVVILLSVVIITVQKNREANAIRRSAGSPGCLKGA